MKAPKRCTMEYVYAKLKVEITNFLENEIYYLQETQGDIYGFTAEEMAIYDCLCTDLMHSIEESSLKYEELKEHFENLDEELPW